jgi:polyisoprenoid-binding protein YceI
MEMCLIMTATATVLSELGLRTGVWRHDEYHSSVLFSIRHLGLAKVRGRFERFEAALTVGETIAETSITATIDLGSINTNNADRDAHLQSTDFFSTGEHPEMIFVSTGIIGAGDSWKLSGDITLNGVTKPITFDVEFNGVELFTPTGNHHAGFTATGTIKRSQFGIEFGIMPLGVDRLALADDVKVELDLEFIEPQG